MPKKLRLPACVDEYFSEDLDCAFSSCPVEDLPLADLCICEYCSDIVPVLQTSLSWYGSFDHSELGEDQRLWRLEVGLDSLHCTPPPLWRTLDQDQVCGMG